jgi:hypothetical protein
MCVRNEIDCALGHLPFMSSSNVSEHQRVVGAGYVLAHLETMGQRELETAHHVNNHNVARIFLDVDDHLV